MKKTICAEEATELELQFNNGKSLNLHFNIKALSFINDKGIGGLKGLLERMNVPEYCAKIIYMTAKAAGEEMTLQKARKLTCTLSPKTITTIVQEFQSLYGSDADEESQKKTAEEIIKSILMT